MKEHLRYAIARLVLPLLFLVFICGVWASIGGFITLWAPLSLFVLGAHFATGMRDLLEWAAENPGKSLADAVLRDSEDPDD